MAQQTVTYESLMKELTERKFRPLYYLTGEEPYYIDKIADWIADNALLPEERDFNQTILFGSDVNASQIADAARRYPMMAERQVIIVKEAQNVKNTEPLEKYLKNPMPTTILVMCHKNGTIDKRKREYVRLIQQVGVLFQSPKLRERDLPPFINNYLKQKGATIDVKSTQLIADHIGPDLSRLVGELDKVLLSLPEGGKTVTPQVVEEQIGVSKDFNTFELRAAVVNKDVYKANQILNYFEKNPKAGNINQYLVMLFNYFQNLLITYYCPERQSQEKVAQWLELRDPWAARDYMTGQRNYPAMKTVQILQKIHEVNAKIRGLDNPNTSPEDLAKELIFTIMH